MNDTIEKFDDRTEYKRDGELHRDNDLPAIEFANGTKVWYLNDKLHRSDGPAIERADGTKFWYLNGQLHRTDGPAIERAAGSKEWYLNDVELTEEEIVIQLAVIRYEQAMIVV